MTPKNVWIMALSAMLVMITSCTPQYKTYVNYSPPTSAKGQSCIQDCLAQRKKCRNTCSTQSEQCERQARSDAAHYFLEANEAHERSKKKLRRDRHRLRNRIKFIQEKEDLCWQSIKRTEKKRHSKHKSVDQKTNHHTTKCKALENKREELEAELDALQNPPQPTLHSFLNTDHCSPERCRCDNDHDQCFQVCGGQLSRDTRCVANCK